jgi:hypothetical protein
MRALAMLVLPPLLLALASACGGAVAQSLEGPPPDDGGTDAAPPVNQNCGANSCPGYVEAAPAAGGLCGTADSCCPAGNASHVGETRSFSCPNRALGTAVCRPSPGGGAGTWAVTSACPVSTGGACTYAGDPSPKAVTSYGTCGEGVNITSAPATDCGGAGAAFEYVPQTDTLATRIELFTTPGVVALLDSDAACDKPGALLFQQALDGASDQIGWRGADVYPPIALKAQHKYFLHMAPGASGSIACSVAESGVFVREYTGHPGGPWEGPFSGLAWMGRVVGVCP